MGLRRKEVSVFRSRLFTAHGISEFHDLFEGIGLCLCLTIRFSRT